MTFHTNRFSGNAALVTFALLSTLGLSQAALAVPLQPMTFRCDDLDSGFLIESPWKFKSIVGEVDQFDNILFRLKDYSSSGKIRTKLIPFSQKFNEAYYVCDEPLLQLPFSERCQNFKKEIYTTTFRLVDKTRKGGITIKYNLEPSSLYLRYFGLLQDGAENTLTCHDENWDHFVETGLYPYLNQKLLRHERIVLKYRDMLVIHQVHQSDDGSQAKTLIDVNTGEIVAPNTLRLAPRSEIFFAKEGDIIKSFLSKNLEDFVGITETCIANGKKWKLELNPSNKTINLKRMTSDKVYESYFLPGKKITFLSSKVFSVSDMICRLRN
jgi:hypothetical protein